MLEQFVRKFDSQSEEEERAQEDLQVARGIFERIFERISQEPTEYREGPRFKTDKGVEVQLSRTDYRGHGPGLCFNLSIIDRDNILHGYAQIREGDKRIMYWGPRDQRCGGSSAQDQQVIEVLEHAERLPAQVVTPD